MPVPACTFTNADDRLADDRAVRLAVPRATAVIQTRLGSEEWPRAGAGLSRIRQIIAVNLPLGLLVVTGADFQPGNGLEHAASG